MNQKQIIALDNIKNTLWKDFIINLENSSYIAFDDLFNSMIEYLCVIIDNHEEQVKVLEKENEQLRGCKFSDRNYHALKARVAEYGSGEPSFYGFTPADERVLGCKPTLFKPDELTSIEKKEVIPLYTKRNNVLTEIPYGGFKLPRRINIDHTLLVRD